MLSFGSTRSGPVVAALFALPLTAFAAEASERVVYSFKGGLESARDGGGPLAGLINVDGKLYGTTAGGGDSGGGTVFSVTPAGFEKVVYSFKDDGRDGTSPVAGLIYVGGKFYGTTSFGGAYTSEHPPGYGTVFSVTPAGAEKVLYSFKGGRDGVVPVGDLINVGGKFYGMTEEGGDYGFGTVFSVTPAGFEKVVYSFKGVGARDGLLPYGRLIYVGGKLYGTTREGGDYGFGTVFSVTPTGVEKVVYSFKDMGDGVSPDAGLIKIGGKFYGTTLGAVFSVTPAGAEKVVYSFKGSRDGFGAVAPGADLINLGGTLYGTTYLRGDYDFGTVFSVTLAGVEKVVHSFKGMSARDGAHPHAGLINLGGALYGTTQSGGDYGSGTVFEITP